MTLLAYTLNYNKCTPAELRGFIQARSGSSDLAKDRRCQNIRILEQLDMDAKFEYFLQLPAELRLVIYTFLFRGDGCRKGFNILLCSRLTYREARAIRYQEQALTTRVLVWRSGKQAQIRHASFYGEMGPMTFTDTQALDEYSLPSLLRSDGPYMTRYASRLALMRTVHIRFPLDGSGVGPWPMEALRAYLEGLTSACENLQTLHLDIPGINVDVLRHQAYVSVALSPLTRYKKRVTVLIGTRMFDGHLSHPETWELLEEERKERGEGHFRWVLEKVANVSNPQLLSPKV